MLIHNLFKNFLSGSMYQVHQKLLVRVCSLEHKNNLLVVLQPFTHETWLNPHQVETTLPPPCGIWFEVALFLKNNSSTPLPHFISPGENCPPLVPAMLTFMTGGDWSCLLPAFVKPVLPFPDFLQLCWHQPPHLAIFKLWGRETHLSSFRPTELVEITGLEEMLTILKEDNLGEGFVLRWHVCQQTRGTPPRRTTE